jgi:hypothetical protein
MVPTNKSLRKDTFLKRTHTPHLVTPNAALIAPFILHHSANFISFLDGRILLKSMSEILRGKLK